MINPAVAAQLAGTPTPAGELASAEAYDATFGAIRNTDYCYIIADNVAAGNGAPLATQWDGWLALGQDSEGGFWRIVYDAAQTPAPVSNWSTLVEPGDIVIMSWSASSGHITTVLGGNGPDHTAPLIVYDNIYYPPGHPDRESIGIHYQMMRPGFIGMNPSETPLRSGGSIRTSSI
jgi:hypothetical protein